MSHVQPTVGIYTLGCKVNQYESEAIAEAFEAHGLAVCPPTALCDVYVINTCTVTGESDRKAGQFIRRAIHRNPKAFVLVTGCFSQTQPERLASIPGVDFVCGNARKLAVVDAALELLRGQQKPEHPTVLCSAPDDCGFESMQIRRFERTRAYIKIEDGCESRCTYCIIPAARGHIRSKPMEEVLCEVRALTASGCREVVLTGIETASYGRDLGDASLIRLLEEIDRIPHIGRVRLGSLDPSLIKPDFVERLSRLTSLAPHFHLSMQSGSDHVLALMKRKYNARMALEAVERLRAAIPDAQFTTDMIVGFPQETDEDFEATMELARNARFLMIHVFPYSRRIGTPAAAMSGQVPGEIKRARAARLGALSEQIRNELLTEQLGRTVSVLFETDAEDLAIGHTPDFIEVTVPCDVPLSGTTRDVRLTALSPKGCYGFLV